MQVYQQNRSFLSGGANVRRRLSPRRSLDRVRLSGGNRLRRHLNMFPWRSSKRRKGGLYSVKNIAAFVSAVAASFIVLGAGVAQTARDSALNNPDEKSWQLFMTVNASVAGAGDNSALFETWASDGDTFRPSPAWPDSGAQMQIGPRALMLALERFHSRLTPEVLPGGAALIGEETRRNKPDFDFIVENKLFKVSGLRAAYRAAKRIAFPDDSIEVKANWVEVGRLAGVQWLRRIFGRRPSGVSREPGWGERVRSRRISHHIQARSELDLGDFRTQGQPGPMRRSGLQGSFRRERRICRAPLRGRVSDPLPRLRQVTRASRAVRQGSHRPSLPELLPQRLSDGLHRSVRPGDPPRQFGDRADFRRPILVHDVPRPRRL